MLDLIIIILALVFLYITYKDKILEKFGGIKYQKNIQRIDSKYEFGKYVINPKQTLVFWIEASHLPFDSITKIFMYNNRTLEGISAVCYVMGNKHSWKLYADDAHIDVIGNIAQEIYGCYHNNMEVR